MGIASMILSYLAQKEANTIASEENARRAQLQDQQMKLMKQKFKMTEDLYQTLQDAQSKGYMSKDQAIAIMHDPSGPLGQVWALGGLGGQQAQKQPPPPTFEETGQAFRPTQEMLPNLPQQIAQQNLFGGMSQQDIAKDIIYKKTGIGHQTQPNRTMQVGRNIVQILNNGQSKLVLDSQGNPLVVPPKAEWKQAVIGNQIVEIAYDEQGKIIDQNGTPLIRTNIPQNQQFLRGMETPTGPATMPIPPGGFPPGTQLPESVTPERLDIEGPQKELSTIFINKFTGEPVKGKGPSTPTEIPSITTKPGEKKGTQIKPPQPLSADISTKVNQVKRGLDSLEQYKKLLFNPDGTINRGNLATGALTIPGTGGKGLARTKGRQMRGYLFGAIDPIMRAASGMMIRPEEEDKYYQRYGADWFMNDEQIRENWAYTINFLKDQAGMLDPNTVWTKDLATRFNKLSELPASKGKLIHFEVGQDEYFIPPEKVEKFLNKFPKARRLSE